MRRANASKADGSYNAALAEPRMLSRTRSTNCASVCGEVAVPTS